MDKNLLSNSIQEIKNSIHDDQAKVAISQLQKIINKWLPQFENEILLYASAHNKIIKDERMNIVDRETITKEKLKLEYSLLKLLGEIEVIVAKDHSHNIKTGIEVEIEDTPLQKNNTDQVNISGNVAGSTIIIGNDNKVQNQSTINVQSNYQKIERLMLSLLGEMRNDLLNNPTTREFVILKRGWVYNHQGHYLVYYIDEHEDLEGKLQVLENLGLIREITYNNVKRFIFLEEFVDYLVNNKYFDEQ